MQRENLDKNTLTMHLGTSLLAYSVRYYLGMYCERITESIRCFLFFKYSKNVIIIIIFLLRLRGNASIIIFPHLSLYFVHKNESNTWKLNMRLHRPLFMWHIWNLSAEFKSNKSLFTLHVLIKNRECVSIWTKWKIDCEKFFIVLLALEWGVEWFIPAQTY